MVGRTAVDEVDPREVVEVAVLAGHDEAGGDGGRQLAGIRQLSWTYRTWSGR